ncbi:hypothetical protein QBC44DRAFT_370552 [Cladorrhinum sp. PSN332]|nr:hypothetical protein QBC44DRAFT_370552 [Cladorrhinum sp. PSN332]
MDAPQQHLESAIDGSNRPSYAHMSPPTLPGQVQPWKQWYPESEVDTYVSKPEDNTEENCGQNAQAVTAV